MGRRGRTWASPVGGLWFTLVWPVDPAARESGLAGLGLRVGLACAESIAEVMARQTAPADPGRTLLKWPNDVLIDGLKVCGALTEISPAPERGAWVLAGIGINANFPRTALPPEVRERSATLLDACGEAIDAHDLLDVLLRRLRVALDEPGLTRPTLDAIRRRLHGVGSPIRASMPDGRALEGTLRGIDDAGRALVERQDGGVLAVASGELEEAEPPHPPEAGPGPDR